MKLYHGSNELISKLDPSKNRTVKYGSGLEGLNLIYATTSMDYASIYGQYIYEIEVDDVDKFIPASELSLSTDTETDIEYFTDLPVKVRLVKVQDVAIPKATILDPDYMSYVDDKDFIVRYDGYIDIYHNRKKVKRIKWK